MHPTVGRKVHFQESVEFESIDAGRWGGFLTIRPQKPKNADRTAAPPRKSTNPSSCSRCSSLFPCHHASLRGCCVCCVCGLLHQGARLICLAHIPLPTVLFHFLHTPDDDGDDVFFLFSFVCICVSQGLQWIQSLCITCARTLLSIGTNPHPKF